MDESMLLPVVLPFACRTVTAANPTTVAVAKKMLWAITPMALWWYERFGSLDAAVMFTHHNVEHFTMFVKAHRSKAWRHCARAVLRSVGRKVNPGSWPLKAPEVGKRKAVPPYSFEDEGMFVRAALLPGRLNHAGRIWVMVASFGAGLSGREASLATVHDLTECNGGRIAVNVRGRHPRIVPIRVAYTHLAREAVAASDGDSFFRGTSREAAMNIAQCLPDDPRTTGVREVLSLRRARNTWLAAHLAANTPFAALRVIAGPISALTLDTLIDHVHAGIGPEEALEQGMRA